MMMNIMSLYRLLSYTKTRNSWYAMNWVLRGGQTGCVDCILLRVSRQHIFFIYNIKPYVAGYVSDLRTL